MTSRQRWKYKKYIESITPLKLKGISGNAVDALMCRVDWKKHSGRNNRTTVFHITL